MYNHVYRVSHEHPFIKSLKPLNSCNTITYTAAHDCTATANSTSQPQLLSRLSQRLLHTVQSSRWTSMAAVTEYEVHQPSNHQQTGSRQRRASTIQARYATRRSRSDPRWKSIHFTRVYFRHKGRRETRVCTSWGCARLRENYFCLASLPRLGKRWALSTVPASHPPQTTRSNCTECHDHQRSHFAPRRELPRGDCQIHQANSRQKHPHHPGRSRWTSETSTHTTLHLHSPSVWHGTA